MFARRAVLRRLAANARLGQYFYNLTVRDEACTRWWSGRSARLLSGPTYGSRAAARLFGMTSPQGRA